jgi:hypothetical protein
MYDNMEKKTCDGCGNEFEYYNFAMSIPTHCRECQRVVSLEQRRVEDKKRRERLKRIANKKPKAPEEVVLEEVKVEPEPVKLSPEIEAIIKYGPIQGVRPKLIMKYGNIKKLTGILNKKS